MSTRIFVRGLPPTFTEAEFRSHFGKQSEVTDARLIPHRRIGYVGYKTWEAAEAAVKYFNKSYIRMSKIGVEIAKSIADSRQNARPIGDDLKLQPDALSVPVSGGGLKRKREENTGSFKPPNKRLQEFLEVMRPGAKSNTWSNEDHTEVAAPVHVPVAMETTELNDPDNGFSDLPLTKTAVLSQTSPISNSHTADASGTTGEVDVEMVLPRDEATCPVSDADWLRSKTSRVLGLMDDVDPFLATPTVISGHDFTQVCAKEKETSPLGGTNMVLQHNLELDETTKTLETISQSGRLFVRNLPYSATEQDLREHFSICGPLQEVHLPVDNKSQSSKGFVYVLYKDPAHAVKAFKELDGQGFQGRLLHILPAAPRRENKLDDFAISKLPLKKQREIRRKAAAATSQFSWNSMYMNTDAVLSSVATKLGVSKADLLDPTSSDAAVRQAHAETHVIQETKKYMLDNGVNLEAFSSRERDDRIILIKNFPFGTTPDELRTLLSEYGQLSQLLMPPTGTIAIAEFQSAPSARASFAALAYRRFKEGILFLEKGPKGLFSGKKATDLSTHSLDVGKDAKVSGGDLKDLAPVEPGTEDVTTLFVRNISFSTSSDGFTLAFRPLDGFLWAKIKTRSDSKNPGRTLSMGFGFVGFQTSSQARTALSAMDGYTLDGHKLSVKIAHKGTDAASERKGADAKKNAAMKQTKIIIKNLPFEATKKDIRSLFGKYGALRTVRMPKKFGNRTRGFAFAEFVTAKEALNAMEALKDTHLLGRRLVLDYAQQNSEDAEEEIERMSKKVSKQTDMVALAKLKENSKSKVVLDETGAVDME